MTLRGEGSGGALEVLFGGVRGAAGLRAVAGRVRGLAMALRVPALDIGDI